MPVPLDGFVLDGRAFQQLVLLLMLFTIIFGYNSAVRAVSADDSLLAGLVRSSGFTDRFQSKGSVNTQAKAAQLFQDLYLAGGMESVEAHIKDLEKHFVDQGSGDNSSSKNYSRCRWSE